MNDNGMAAAEVTENTENGEDWGERWHRDHESGERLATIAAHEDDDLWCHWRERQRSRPSCDWRKAGVSLERRIASGRLRRLAMTRADLALSGLLPHGQGGDV